MSASLLRRSPDALEVLVKRGALRGWLLVLAVAVIGTALVLLLSGALGPIHTTFLP